MYFPQVNNRVWPQFGQLQINGSKLTTLQPIEIHDVFFRLSDDFSIQLQWSHSLNILENLRHIKVQNDLEL